MTIELITRQGCHLCEEAESLLQQMGVSYRARDVDEDPDLAALYSDAIPVILADGQEIARAPIRSQSLAAKLRAAGRQSIP